MGTNPAFTLGGAVQVLLLPRSCGWMLGCIGEVGASWEMRMADVRKHRLGVFPNTLGPHSLWGLEQGKWGFSSSLGPQSNIHCPEVSPLSSELTAPLWVSMCTNTPWAVSYPLSLIFSHFYAAVTQRPSVRLCRKLWIRSWR